MATYSIGKSSYGDLKGTTQYVNTQRIADQFLSLAADFAANFGKNGDRLSPNEGMRSRPRQILLYNNYLRTGYPIAANPYTSRHDEVFHGNAVDVGVTRADGSNRALTSEEFAWMHDQAERRGFTWTGRNFNEPWHIEGATRKEVLPPYPGISDAPIKTPEPAKPEAPTLEEEDDMVAIVAIKGGSAPGEYMVDFGQRTKWNVAKGTTGTEQAYARIDVFLAMGIKRYKDQAPWVLAGFRDITDAK